MEARDAAAADPPSAASREGPTEEDGLLLATVELATDAGALFQSRHYSECIDVLRRLLLKKEDDPKVLHNIAIAEYFSKGCPDPKKLLDDLGDIEKRSEDLAHAPRIQLEAANSVGSNSTSVSNVVHLLSAANSCMHADEFDTSIVVFNKAVILYHLHDYAHALSVLEPLYQNIEPIDEATALHICFLLLDIALASQDATKAADVIQYLEKSFGVTNTTNQIDNGTSAQHQPLNQSKVAAKPNTTTDVPCSDQTTSATAVENSLIGNVSDETLDFEILYLNLEGGNQNMGRPVLNDFSMTSADLTATAADLKVKLQLYKVRFLLLTRNWKAAKRELKLAMKMAKGRDSSTELLLKSQLEYARSKHPKAVKLLGSLVNRTEPSVLVMFYNNNGCISYQQRSYHISNYNFCRALKHSLQLQSEKPLKLAADSQDKPCLISYNSGLAHMACGKPLLAACCFRKAYPFFFKQPLFWLRFAECCLLALDKETTEASSCDGEIQVHVLGSGKWRRLLVKPMNLRNICALDSRKSHGPISKEIQGSISLPFAQQCLLNVLLLLDYTGDISLKSGSFAVSSGKDDPSQAANISCKNSGQKGPASTDSRASNLAAGSKIASVNGDAKGGMGSNSTLQDSVAFYEDICRRENIKIMRAALADLAYVELCLENPLKALSYAKSLQQLPECPKMYIFLGHMYSAEALCLLNRPKEAAEQLSVYLVDGTKVELPYSDVDQEKWITERGGDSEHSTNQTPTKSGSEEAQRLGCLKPEEARGMLYVNLAAVSAMQGGLEQASHFMKQGLASLPNNPRALLAAVYVDIRGGKVQEAITKLREGRHVRFIRNGAACQQLN